MGSSQATRPAGEALREWWAKHAPTHLRDVDPETLPDVEFYDHETAQERLDRLAVQAAAKRRLYAERLPQRYHDASLANLLPQQQPDRVRPWLDSGRLGLMLAGAADLGKTYAAYAVTNEASERGLYVLAWTVADLNAAMRPSAPDAERTYDRVIACDLLLLDDVGREQVTAWSLETLQRILDARNRERLRTIYTSNIGYDDLVARYGSPVVGRILDDCVVAKVEGDSLRPAAPW